VTFGVRMREGEGRHAARAHRVRRGTGTLYRKLQSLKFLLTRDRRAVLSFLTRDLGVPMSTAERLALLARFTRITNEIRGYHTLVEILTVTEALLERAGRGPLLLVECGTGSGSSTAKLSLAARHAGARLIAFDSFTGIPENDELHHFEDGRELRFAKGAFKGSLSAVEKRIARFGAPERVRLVKGLFHETLPGFAEPIDVALLDVDLASSTRSCLVHLFPRLRPDGVLFSQDGHIRETHEMIADEAFWREEVGVAPPEVHRRGDGKLLELRPR